jgi:hypothetical protein
MVDTIIHFNKPLVVWSCLACSLYMAVIDFIEKGLRGKVHVLIFYKVYFSNILYLQYFPQIV